MAFYAALSFLPFMLLATSLLGFFLASSSAALVDINSFIAKNFPEAAATALKVISDTTRGKTIYGLIGLIGVLWGSTRVFAVTEEAMNRIWRTKGRRGFWESRFVAFICIPIMMLFVLISLALTTVLQALADNLVPLVRVNILDAPIIGPVILFGFPILISTLLFTWLYYLLPSRWRHLRSAFFGALLAGILWEIAKLLFDSYVKNFGEWLTIYGSFTSLALLLFWVYYSAFVVLFGAEFGSLLQAVRERGHAHLDSRR